MMIQPFGTDDEKTAPAFWVLEVQLREVSAADLLKRFYDELDPDEPLSCKPLGQVYNPENKEGQRIYAFNNEQVCLFPYRRGFYVVVEKHWRLMEGPHAGKLFYKCFQIPSTVWVATLQVEGMFYNDETLRTQLTAAILNHEFYQSERSAGEIITL